MASKEWADVVEMIRAAPVTRPGEEPSVEEMRGRMDVMGDVLPVAKGTSIEAVDANGVPCEWVMSDRSRANRVVLFYHGGGYMMGSPKSHRTLTSKLAEVAECRVLSVDYRLAPEDPFPAAVEDGVATYRWLLDQGYSVAEIGVSGDSAGGGLTIATLVSARDQGLPMPACAIPISPWADLTCQSETMKSRADVDPIVQPDSIGWTAETYLGGQRADTPLASPVYSDLAGLPPLLIQVGDYEVLLNDSRLLDQRAKAAGVDSTLEVWDEMFHVWHLYHSMMPEAEQAIVRMAEYLEAHWPASRP